MNQNVELVHRSATRRKACSGCVKAKRRCDLIIPTCSRCTARNLVCRYNDNETVLAVDSVTVKHSAPLTPQDGALPQKEAADPGPQIHNFIFTPVDINVVEEDSPTVLGDFGSPYDSFPFPELGYLNPDQIDFCVSRLKGCTTSLVLEGRTPFIHPILYHEAIPIAYQDVLSVCALYMQRNPHNTELLSRILDVKLKALIQASKSIIKVEHRLLAVQALLLYQIILVLDEDFRKEADVQCGLNMLDTWATQLQEDYFDADITSFGSSQRQWIMLESIRRTLMVSVLLRCLYKVMQEGVTDLVPLLAILPVSRNNLRWDSPSFDWQEDQYHEEALVTYAGYVQDWNEGIVGAAGEYESLLLRACRHATRGGIQGLKDGDSIKIGSI